METGNTGRLNTDPEQLEINSLKDFNAIPLSNNRGTPNNKNGLGFTGLKDSNRDVFEYESQQ